MHMLVMDCFGQWQDWFDACFGREASSAVKWQLPACVLGHASELGRLALTVLQIWVDLSRVELGILL